MSTYLGLDDNGNALLHMTSDAKTVEQLKTQTPLATTVFHSSLPYLLVRKQFTLDSYTNYNGTGGGRTFALSTDLKNYANANSQAYLLVMEDSSGNKWVHSEMMNTVGMQFNYSTTGYYGAFSAAGNGAEYFTAYSNSNTSLDQMSNNSAGGASFVFRPWDPTSDTQVTVWRITQGVSWIDWAGGSRTFNTGTQHHTGIQSAMRPAKWSSSGLDVVKLHYVFLNITQNSQEFEIEPNFATGRITLDPDDFTVNGVDMLSNLPILAKGVQSSGASVTPLYGYLAGGKTVSISEKLVGKVSTSNAVSRNNTPVIEIPNPPVTGAKMIYDLKEQKIWRSVDGNRSNDELVFSSSIIADGLKVIGTKEIQISSFTYGTGGSNNSGTTTIATTQTGSFDGADGNTMYLASILYDGTSLMGAQLFGVGNNALANFMYGNYLRTSTFTAYSYTASQFYLQIDNQGNCSFKRKNANAYWTSNVASASATFTGGLTIRLIGLDV